MRILHIHSGNLYGGVETLLATLARSRDMFPAIEPEFALSFEGNIASELREALVPVHSLGKVRSRRPLTILHARRRLRRLLTERRFDAAICHMPWAQAIFGPVVRSAGVPLIFWMHGAATGRHWLERWARLTPPDLVLCNSYYTASSVQKLFVKTPHEVFRYPVARSQQPLGRAKRVALRAEFDSAGDAVVIIQASRMEPWKGHALHLKALGLLRDLPRWVCWIVGGPQRPDEEAYWRNLQNIALGLRISDRVRFLGQRSDIAQLLGAADIYCQPNTIAEPFGIAFVEALLATLPVVTTTLGGAIESVDRSCGITVAPGDAQALADGLRTLIQSAEARARLGAAGPVQAARLCDPRTQLNKLHQVIAGVANNHVSRNKCAVTKETIALQR